MHSAQGKEAYRSHPEMLFTGNAKRSLRDIDACANFGEIKRLVRMSRQKILEFRDERAVPAVTDCGSNVSAFGKTSHHGVNQSFFQRTANCRQFQ
jgi:hypothetical protein